uniref:Uncharacterized protein n=1 Tax=viral metagenome TaxID=1070528 RepID=A0A6C0ICV6_9ZZZZ
MSTDYIKKVLTQSHQGLSITKEAKEGLHEFVSVSDTIETEMLGERKCTGIVYRGIHPPNVWILWKDKKDGWVGGVSLYTCQIKIDRDVNGTRNILLKWMSTLK